MKRDGLIAGLGLVLACDGGRAAESVEAGAAAQHVAAASVEATPPAAPEPVADPTRSPATGDDAGPDPAPTAPADTPDPPAGMVLVPAGSFTLGYDTEERDCQHRPPARQLVLEAFHIDRTEVTVAAYQACVEAGSCTTEGMQYRGCAWKTRSSRANHAMDCTTWEQAQAYCAWAGKRLPTEVEWEKAARGTDGRLFPWGNEPAPYWDPRRELDACQPGFTAPVGCYPEDASPYGVVDMAGNVLEWVAAWPGPIPAGDAPDPTRATAAAWRGGSIRVSKKWWGDLSCRHPATRWGDDDEDGANKRAGMFNKPGFRCARDAPQAGG